jgi:SMC interacting uncharacterized protein involved in chromosome segregation
MADWRSTYNDLCKEIEILELRASDLEFQMKLARKVCFRGFVTDQYSRIPLDKALNNYDAVKDELNTVDAMLEHKKHTKRQIEQKMSEFDGLEYQVAYRRDVLRHPLDKIADDLGYSYNWIMKVSARTTYRAKGRKKAETA